MVHKGNNDNFMAVLAGWLTGSGFGLAWFSSLFCERLCVFDRRGAVYMYLRIFLVTFFTSPFRAGCTKLG